MGYYLGEREVFMFVNYGEHGSAYFGPYSELLARALRIARWSGYIPSIRISDHGKTLWELGGECESLEAVRYRNFDVPREPPVRLVASWRFEPSPQPKAVLAE